MLINALLDTPRSRFYLTLNHQLMMSDLETMKSI